MSKQDNLTDFLTDVADAIREKKGTADKINPQNFSDEIRGIESGNTFSKVMIDADGRGKYAVTKVIVDEGVTEISSYAYYSLPFVEIEFPQSLIKIGSSAMESCSYITELIFPDSVTYIGSRMCYACGKLKKITLPRSLTTMGVTAFESTPISNPVFIPPLLMTIHNNAFAYCSQLPAILFTEHTAVPTLSNTAAMSPKAIIVVPDALYDEWIAATNWSSLASRIVKASEYVEPTNE
jgi:hypothetical protein